MAQLALYAYTTLSVTRLHEILDGLASLRLPLVFGLICAVFVFLAPASTRGNILQQAEVKAVLALGAVALLSIPLSVWPAGSIDFVANTYSRVLAFYFFLIILARSAAHLRGVVWALIVGGCVLGLATALELKALDGAWQTEMGRRAYASATYDPNEVAMLMACLIPFAGYGVMFGRRWLTRALLAGVGAIAMLALVKTVSRGGFLGLVGVLAVMVFRIWQGGRRRLAIGLVLSVIALSFIAPSSYWAIMETILAAERGDNYLDAGITPRWEIWKEGFALFLRNPITGVGVGQFEVGYGLARGGGGKWSAAHNSFVQIGAELGVAGLVLFVWLLLRALRDVRFAARMARTHGEAGEPPWIAYATEASLVGYIICGSALSAAYWALLYLLLAVSLLLRLQAERTLRPGAARPALAEAVHQ